MANYDFTYTGAEIQVILDTAKKLKDSGYIFLGVATPGTNPGTPTQKVYYEAKQAGTYTNFGGAVLPDGISLLIWNGSWTSETVMCGDGGVFDISVYKSSGGTLATFADLSAALDGGNNIPASARKGGMSVKFVQSSDNKYVQYRLTANTFTTDITKWQNMSDFVEDAEHPIADNEVAGCLTDKNKTVIAKLMKSGAIEWLVENSKDIANNARFEDIEELLSYVSSEVPDSDNGVIKYLTDKDGKVIATINNVGNTEFKGGGGFDGEITKSMSIGFDAVKVLTDKKGSVIGYIDSEGGVYFCNLKNQVSGSDDISYMMNLVSNGGKGPSVLNILNKLPKKTYFQKGKEYHTNGFMSFHDDDTLDQQIPVSSNPNATPETRTSENVGGFASFLYPFMKSITERHKLGKKLIPNTTTNGYDLVDDDNPTHINGKLVYGLAAEGQRIGLIDRIYSDIDSFDGKLNLCGELASKLHFKYGWDIMCHSMTARYLERSYWVDSLDDPLVSEIETLAIAYGKHLNNNPHQYYIHCTDSNLDYEYRIDDNNVGAWHVVNDIYIRPYLAKSLVDNAPIYFNPRYSELWQVAEWKKRAQIAGLPFIDCGVSWGSSPSKKNLLIRYEVFNNWFASGKKHICNDVPLGSSGISRGSCHPSDETNRWQNSKYNQLIDLVDECVNDGKWLIVAGHAYEVNERNYYLDGIDYGDRRCDSYPSEWIIPLRQEELETIDENNYWENPPVRLGISSWAEWYPCPGTTYDMFMNVIEYAISRGVEFGSTEEGLRRFKNNFCIGTKLLGIFEADKRLVDSEKDSTWDNHIIVGCDGSVEYNIK